MSSKIVRTSWPLMFAGLVGLAVLVREGAETSTTPATDDAVALRPAALVQRGDRVAWVGSSSTKIGVWTRTVEFLIRTRHPELGVEFHRHTTGGGTFQTGLEHLDGWLDESEPTLVVLNYGGNDAGVGPGGLDRFLDRMDGCVAKVRARGARPVLVTPQAADVRKSGRQAAAYRALFAEAMLQHGRANGWPVIDVHTPLDALQKVGVRDDPCYSILKDRIHLTDAAYVAWGYVLYDRLDLPRAVSEATLTASGGVDRTTGCEIRDVRAEPDGDGLSFVRVDRVLPVFPPAPLPPADVVPVEALSAYRLKVVGLKPGVYDLTCDGRPIGAADDVALRLGVNLNALLLESGHEAPWAALAREVWEGRPLDDSRRPPRRFALARREAAGPKD